MSDPYYTSTGAIVRLGQELGRGGEGVILHVEGDPSVCAKVYSKKQSDEYHRKLLVMVENPPADPTFARGQHRSIAWPQALLYADQARRDFRGFTMPQIDLQKFKKALGYLDPGDRLQRFQGGGFTWQYLFITGYNIASAMAAIHERGHCIGDFNESNLVIAPSALITLLDCDSFQVMDRKQRQTFRCPVGKPEYTAPELQGKSFRDHDRTVASDSFALAVMLFQLFMEGTHPYQAKGKLVADAPTTAAKIIKGHFPYGPQVGDVAPPDHALPFTILAPEVQRLFLRCFTQGHGRPEHRPTAHDWFKALGRLKKKFHTCTLNSYHVFPDHIAVGNCPWCALEQKAGKDLFPSGAGQQVALRPPKIASLGPGSALPSAKAAPSPSGGAKRGPLPLRPVGRRRQAFNMVRAVLARGPKVRLAVAAAVALLMGLFLLAWVLTGRTPHGTLEVSVSEPGVQLLIDGEEKLVVDSTKVGRLELIPGKHELIVRRGAVDLYTKQITLKSGGEVIIEAKWTPQLVSRPPPTWPETKKEPAPAPIVPPVQPGPSQAVYWKFQGRDFALVPKGTGWLGGGGGTAGQKQVYIPYDFYLGVYTVTQGEWETIMGNNPSWFSRKGQGQAQVQQIADADLKQFPVENVSWEDAQQFIGKLKAQDKSTGWVYRLPTEMEWEYACRGGPIPKQESGFDYYFAKPTNQLLSSQANFNLRHTVKVGSYQPNRLGICDMHGNVWQWCEDSRGAARVIRGGGWCNSASDGRAAHRFSRPPSSRSLNLGFRLARVPSG